MRQTHGLSKKFHARWLLVVLTILVVFFAVRNTTTSANANHTITESGVDTSESRLVAEPKSVQYPSSKVIDEFFRTHSHKAVREELYLLLRNEQVRVSWNVVGATIANFGITLDEQGELVPVLAMDPELFLDHNRSIAQITVYHEYLHYVQWRDDTVPRSTFLIRDDLPYDEIHDWCKEKWHAEVLAYHEACAFGRENGLVDDLRPGGPLSVVCTAQKQRFVPILKRVLTRADPSGAMCSNTWNSI